MNNASIHSRVWPDGWRPTLSEDQRLEFLNWQKTSGQFYSVQWSVDFHMVDPLQFSPEPRQVLVQEVHSPGYWSSGMVREYDEFCYLSYTLSGAGEVLKGDQAYPVPQGHGFLVEINNPEYGYRFPPRGGAPWRFLGLTFQGLVAHAMVRDLLDRYGPVFSMSPDSPVIRRLLSYQVPNHSIVDIQATDGAELVLELLLAAAASASATRAPDALASLVSRAIGIISANLETGAGVSEIAAQAGVSREHLSRAFQQKLHVGPREFILAQKIRHACLLLKQTDLSIKQIAERIGYTDYTNFIRAFRQVVHMTPRDFRLRGSLQLPPQYGRG